MNLSLKIILGVVGITILSTLFLFSNIHTQLIQSKEKSTKAYYLHEMENIKNKTDSIITNSKQILSIASIIDSDVKDLQFRLHNRFEYYLKNVNYLIEIKYITLDGKELVKVSNKKLFHPTSNYDYKTDPLFKKAFESDFSINNIHYTDFYNELAVDVALKVINIDTQETTGIIIAKISMDAVQDIINANLVNFNGMALLDLNSQKFIYKSSVAKDVNHSTLSPLPLGITNLTFNNTNYFIASDEYKNHQLHLKFFLFTQESTLYEDIHETIKENLLLVLILLLFATTIIYWVVETMLQPLQKIIQTIKKLLKNLDKNFKDPEEKIDEIGQIKYYFENFETLINQDRKALNEFNTDLQLRIDQEIEKNTASQKQLFKSEKMAAMGEMIGNIAHQWRQPLSVISTSATAIQLKKQYGLLTDQYLEEACDSINNNAQYLSKTIDDFKNFIAGDRTKIRFNLKENIGSFVSLIQGSLKNHSIHLILELDETISTVGYPNELIQCYMNIYNNAKDSLLDIQSERYFFVTTTLENDLIVIRFLDNAGGIPQEILPKIFNPYFTTKHQKHGTGLGLSMTYNLIKDGMKGNIEASNSTYLYDNRTETGALFTITLPINE